MDSSSDQHQQEMPPNTLENMLVSSKSAQQDPLKPPRPHPEQALKCPRCDSTNTKFCYYNNYSLSQPRYFCKSCRRYWTKGGTLRNVPVGGGCRKNRRSSSTSPCSSSARRSQDQPLVAIQTSQNSPLSHLSYGRLVYDQHQSDHDQFSMNSILGSTATNPPPAAFVDALRCGFMESQSQSQNPSNFHSMYYGNYGGGGQICEQDSTGGGGDMVGMGYGEMGSASTATTTAVTVTTMKQEMCNGREGGGGGGGSENNRMLWGFPWQMNIGDHHDQSINNNINININNMGSVDSGRESWNGFAPSWHGLLNSPLM